MKPPLPQRVHSLTSVALPEQVNEPLFSSVETIKMHIDIGNDPTLSLPYKIKVVHIYFKFLAITLSEKWIIF